MLGFRRWSMSAMVLVTACAFDSGGVPANGASAATIGSHDTSSATTDDVDSGNDTSAGSDASNTSLPGTTATTEPDPDSGMTADPSTTVSSTNPPNDTGEESSGPMVAETGDESHGSLDSSPPLDTGETMESVGTTTDDGGVDPPPDAPYYGDCTEQADCGEGGQCFSTTVNNGPDAHVCLVPCGEGCPAPENGDAMALCTTYDWCVLSCQFDEDCPTGMNCYIFNWQQANEFRRCLWSQG